MKSVKFCVVQIGLDGLVLIQVKEEGSPYLRRSISELLLVGDILKSDFENLVGTLYTTNKTLIIINIGVTTYMKKSHAMVGWRFHFQ